MHTSYCSYRPASFCRWSLLSKSQFIRDYKGTRVSILSSYCDYYFVALVFLIVYYDYTVTLFVMIMQMKLIELLSVIKDWLLLTTIEFAGLRGMELIPHRPAMAIIPLACTLPARPICSHLVSFS